MNDREGDTIRATPAKCCIVTLVDRNIRFLLAKGVDSVSSQKVHDAIKEAFKEKGIHPKTIVFYNGSEFAKFRELETTLQTSIYFADIHSLWQRGSNENINGCLRFFLPRGMDFRNLDDGYLETVVSLLNNRPRKCLGLKSPHEVFCCTWLCKVACPLNTVSGHNHRLPPRPSKIKQKNAHSSLKPPAYSILSKLI